MGKHDHSSGKKYRLECRNKYIANKIAHFKPCDLEYRDITGSNNNKANPTWGEANQQLLRKAPSDYGDNISTPAGASRPSAREISNVVFNEPVPITSPQCASAMLWLWGQFVDHDLDLTPEAEPHEPFPIPVPTGDPYFDPMSMGGKEIPMNRAMWDPTTGTDVNNPRQQINVISAFLDGTNIYGDTQERNNFLRKFKKGKLLYGSDYMPPSNNGQMANAMLRFGSYVCGDVRANENLPLTSMHSIWVREHNYWAGLICKCNPKLCDEEIYQKAKVIVEAELQIITYSEFLPFLLGPDAIDCYRGYDSNVNPQILNEFSTAAYRMGHTLVSSILPRLGKDCKPIWAGNLELKDAFFTPWLLANYAGLDPIIRGILKSNSNKYDAKVIDALRNFLFGAPGDGGLDLVSLNIQRGRDHGLNDFNTTRQACGLPAITSFSQITTNATLATQLQNLYGYVNNIDLWVGILAEDPAHDAIVGPTALAILKDQFERLRDGDRFWYENRFYGSMLRALNRTKLSEVIERNTDVKVEGNPFIFKKCGNRYCECPDCKCHDCDCGPCDCSH